MRKPASDWTPPPIENWRLYKNKVQTYSCTLVTPLYGGGVFAGEVDGKMPIRATTIRGQLRFWWRIAHRNRYVDQNKRLNTEAMYRDERNIWGGLGDSDSLKASKVMVSVRDILPQPVEAWSGGIGSRYALFAGQGTEPAKLLKPGATWMLEIQYSDDCVPEQQEQVATALRWWASFGSVGGRGRRGLGAVKVDGLASISEKEANECGCALVFQDHKKCPLEAWEASIKKLYHFRQGKGMGRNSGSKRPGRSRWPEPDAIRRITEEHAPAHRPEHPAGDLFPRARFGLPIIFHFKDRDDPKGARLKPVNAERMASPVFLRPYFDYETEEWLPAALCIKSESVDLELLTDEVKTKVTKVTKVLAWPKNKDDQQVAVDRIYPLSSILKVLDKKSQKPLSPILAFLRYFREPFHGNEG